MIRLQNDIYKKARGGTSRLLEISCAKCGCHVCYYQKDGPGHLKRMYLDRMSGIQCDPATNLLCPNCKELLAVPMVYKREERAAYRLFNGAVAKRISKG